MNGKISKAATESGLFQPERLQKTMRNLPTSNTSQTDWERIDRMADEEIDLSDIPELTPEAFAKEIVRRGLKPVERKTQLTLRIDSDVVEWFKSQGRGYQTRINELLRAYMEVHINQAR